MKDTSIEIKQKSKTTEQQSPAVLTTTAGGVARMLQISIRQTWRLNKIGKLPRPLRLGNCVRWRVDEIKAFVAAGCPSREEWERLTTNKHEETRSFGTTDDTD